jgi:hypothetical protein
LVVRDGHRRNVDISLAVQHVDVMTLILTVANSRGAHQSSDYQLTDALKGTPLSDHAGSKQLSASLKKLHLQLAFTGIASDRTGRTIDWLSAELQKLPSDSTLQDVCNSLVKRGAAAMKPHGPRGVLTLVIVASEIGRPFRVAQVSNADWDQNPPCAKGHFDIWIRSIKRPFYLISGFRSCVSLSGRRHLQSLAKSTNRTPEQIRDALVNINAFAARQSRGYVSEGCWVSSQFADGRRRHFVSQNVGTHDDSIPMLQGGMDIVDFIKKNFRSAPGRELRLIASGGVLAGPGDQTPLPPPEGDPRRFVISGSSIIGAVRSPSGEHCAIIEISQITGAIVMRRNESVRGPFARVQFKDIREMSADFPKPMLPWPRLSPPIAIDGHEVPRGWEFTVGYWIENGVHFFELPRASRSIRNVAFLGDDDELVVSLVVGCAFAWRPAEEAPTAILEAEIGWRTRLDGTRG